MKLIIEVEYDEKSWPVGPEGSELESALIAAVNAVLHRHEVEVDSEVFLEHVGGSRG